MRAGNNSIVEFVAVDEGRVLGMSNGSRRTQNFQ